MPALPIIFFSGKQEMMTFQQFKAVSTENDLRKAKQKRNKNPEQREREREKGN